MHIVENYNSSNTIEQFVMEIEGDGTIDSHVTTLTFTWHM